MKTRSSWKVALFGVALGVLSGCGAVDEAAGDAAFVEEARQSAVMRERLAALEQLGWSAAGWETAQVRVADDGTQTLSLAARRNEGEARVSLVYAGGSVIVEPADAASRAQFTADLNGEQSSDDSVGASATACGAKFTVTYARTQGWNGYSCLADLGYHVVYRQMSGWYALDTAGKCTAWGIASDVCLGRAVTVPAVVAGDASWMVCGFC